MIGGRDVGVGADHEAGAAVAEDADALLFARGLAVETDDATGLACRVAPVRLGARLEEARPAFW